MTALLKAVPRGWQLMPAALFVALGCMGFSPGAQSQIRPPTPQPIVQCTMSTTPSTISFGNISFARDAPVGSPISDLRWTSTQVNCPVNLSLVGPNAGYYLSYRPNLPLSSTVSDVWQTAIPGIGVKVISTDWNDTVLSTIGVPSNGGEFGPATGRNARNATYRFSYQLIKTGPVNAVGSLSVGPLFQLRSHNVPRNVTSPTLSTVSVNNTNISPRSCDVATANVSVPMPTISRNALRSVGATAGTSMFRIGIACPDNARLRVHMTMSDSTTPGNRTDTLTLTPASTAGGVQLQITGPSGQVVRFGPDSAVARNVSDPSNLINPNQFEIGPSEPLMSLPFSVQYIATGAVTPGTVIGLATFTMSYQ